MVKILKSSRCLLQIVSIIKMFLNTSWIIENDFAHALLLGVGVSSSIARVK